MTREELIEVMADAIGEFMGAKDRLDAYHFDAANHLMRAIEAAGVRLVPVEVEKVAIDVMASLAAAISLLERGGERAAPSRKMFNVMLTDYKKSLARARAYFNSPATLTKDTQ